MKSPSILKRCFGQYGVMLALLLGMAATGLAQSDSLSGGIRLDPGKMRIVASEPRLDREDMLGVVRRWQCDIFTQRVERTLAYQAAMVMDPVTREVADSLALVLNGLTTAAEIETAFNAWSAAHMTHTQYNPQFAQLPGKDPWGLMDSMTDATYKKLLPSEMKAMRRLTGKISGKCMTLANFWGAVFCHLGVPVDDQIFLHLQLGPMRHGVALMKIRGHLMMFDNYALHPFVWPESQKDRVYPVIAVYNFRDFGEVSFTLTRESPDLDKLAAAPALAPAFIEQLNLASDFPEYGSEQPLDYGRLATLRDQVFSATTETVPALARYAYQSLYVRYPQAYLAASLQQSGPKQLADSLKSVVNILNWVRGHIAHSSIFPDGQERLMTADQVLVFKTGSPKDRAVLAYTLLTHRGEEVRCVFTADRAFIKLDAGYYDMASGEVLPAITEPVLFDLTHVFPASVPGETE